MKKVQTNTTIITAMSPVIRSSSRKVQLVAKAVKRMSPKDAIAALSFMPKRAAEPLSKTITQAVANATNNLKIAEQKLRHMTIELREGPTMKRFRIGGRGRTKPVLKRTSQIVVKIAVEGEK